MLSMVPHPLLLLPLDDFLAAVAGGVQDDDCAVSYDGSYGV